MKIAFDYQAFTRQSYGGISRYFARLVQQLYLSGEQVRVFAPFHKNCYLEELPDTIVIGRKLAKYPPKTARIFDAVNHYVVNKKINSWQPDIVHETYYSNWQQGRPQRHPVVVTVFDMVHEIFSDMFEANNKTTRYKRRSLERADHIISISHSTKKDLIRLFDIPANKVSVILLGFDKAFTVAADGKKAHDEPVKPFLLYVGTRSEHKNFSCFLKAVALSSELLSNFDIVAFGGGLFNPAELYEIEKLGFKTDQVKQVTGDDMLLSWYYQNARAFVYPSLYEGFGLPLLEAMAQDCPVVCSNTSSMPEIAGAAAEFFDPSNFEEMSCAIRLVALSDTRAKELIRLGRERLLSFSWHKCAAETLDIYRMLAQ